MEPTDTSAGTQPAPTPQPSPPDEPGKHPKRILLVEDDESLAHVYLTRLQAEGFDVRHVSDGEEALANARTSAGVPSTPPPTARRRSRRSNPSGPT